MRADACVIPEDSASVGPSCLRCWKSGLRYLEGCFRSWHRAIINREDSGGRATNISLYSHCTTLLWTLPDSPWLGAGVEAWGYRRQLRIKEPDWPFQPLYESSLHPWTLSYEVAISNIPVLGLFVCFPGKGLVIFHSQQGWKEARGSSALALDTKCDVCTHMHTHKHTHP